MSVPAWIQDRDFCVRSLIPYKHCTEMHAYNEEMFI